MREISTVLCVACLVALAMPGCGTDASTDPPPELTGDIEVTLTVSGQPPDPDGVRVTVDDGDPQALLDGENHRFTDLTVGSHTVRVSDVSWHCGLAGDPERSIEVRANQTSQVTLSVNCRNIGALVVTTRTAGSGVDPDGYIVQVEGQNALTVSDGAAATWPELGPGQYLMSLLGLADHCWIPGESAMSVEVAAAESTYVSFGIACPPFHDHIAFGSNRDGEIDLWVMRSDGSSPINLTPGALEGNDPSWSPDASRIAFYGGPPDGIWVLEMDGSAPQRIGDGRSPQWSPDGQRILFMGFGGINAMDADGSNVTHVIEAHCESPQWSPDGLEVAFVSGQDCGPGDPDYRKSIYVANLDGTGKRRVSSGATSTRYDMEPAWYPGTRIAFVGHDFDLGLSDIYSIEADGTGLRRLSHSSSGMAAYEPQWKPDGEWVVFSHDPDPEGRQICIVRADGTGYECLTDGPFYHGYPSWSASP